MGNDKYIAFIGDSFTWGQGLYLPYWVDTKPDALRQLSNNIQWRDHEKFVDANDLMIKDKLSFTSIVAKELGRKCVKKVGNGGSNLQNLGIIKSLDLVNVDGEPTPHFSFGRKDMILIFQLTHFGRDDIFNHMTEEEKDEILKVDITDSREAINRLFRNRVKSHFEYIDSVIRKLSNTLKFEYWYLDWNGDFYSFKPEKFIDMRIGNNSGKFFAPLVDTYPIKVKFENRILLDGHLNEEGNRIIAKSILRWLEGV